MGMDSRRKQQKRKERERRVKTAQHSQRLHKIEEAKTRDKVSKEAIAHMEKSQLSMPVDLFLEVLGVDSSTDSSIDTYLHNCNDFINLRGDMSKRFDVLMVMGRNIGVNQMSNADYRRTLKSAAQSLRDHVRDYKRAALTVAESEIARIVAVTPDLESRVKAQFEAHIEELRTMYVEANAVLGKVRHVGIQSLDGIRCAEAGAEPKTADDFVNATKRLFIDPVTHIERFKMGIPTDFFGDVADVVLAVRHEVAQFFLSEVYGNINLQYRSLPDALEGDVLFGKLMEFDDVRILPDPEWFLDLVTAVRSIGYTWGKNTLELVELVASKYKYTDAVYFVRQIGTDEESCRAVAECLHAGSVDAVEQFAFSSAHVPAYKALRKAGYEASFVASFLHDYGDERPNGRTMAEIISGIADTPLFHLIVDHALYLVCDKEGENVLRYAMEHDSVEALTQYLRFAREGQEDKRIAVARFIARNGTNELEQYAEVLAQLTEGAVARVLTHEHGVTVEKAEEWRRIREMKNGDLIEKYHIESEVVNVPAAARGTLDAVLTGIRGTPYEPLLLGKRKLLHKLVERIESEPDVVAHRVKHLHNDVYKGVRQLTTPSSVESPAAERRFDRILLIGDVHPDAVQYIESATGIDVMVLSPTSRPERINSAINPGVLVGYIAAGPASHSTYYGAKNRTIRTEGCEFVHCLTSGRESILNALNTTLKN